MSRQSSGILSRKGFSLVELAIVMVIIAVMFSIVIKGRNIMETSNNLSEVHKIQIIKEFATEQVYDNKWERTVNYPIMDFVISGRLDIKEITPEWGTSLNGGIYSVGVAKKNLHSYTFGTPQKYGLVVTTINKPDEQNPVNRRSACVIEMYLDDANYATGDGMYSDPDVVIDNKPSEQNCSSIKSDQYITYFYSFGVL